MNKQFQVSFSPKFFLLRLEEQATQQNKQCDDLKKRKALVQTLNTPPQAAGPLASEANLLLEKGLVSVPWAESKEKK